MPRAAASRAKTCFQFSKPALLLPHGAASTEPPMTASIAANAAAPRRYAFTINIPPSYASTSNADLFTGTSLPSSILLSILSLRPPSRHCKLCCTRQRTALIYQRIPMPPLALEEAADNAPEHRAPERLTGLAADALAEGRADLVTGAARHLPGDLLAGREPPRPGAENPTEQAASAVLLRGPRFLYIGLGVLAGRLVLGALLKNLGGRLPLDALVIYAGDRAFRDDRLTLGIGHRTDARVWRMDQRALHDRRLALVIEGGNQGLADAEFHDRLLGIEGRVGAKGGRRRLHRLLLQRRERSQGVLHAVAELARHRVRDIERILRDKIDADALRPDQPHHLLDFLQQRLRRILEQEMRLVEEEDELWPVRVAHFRQFRKQLRQQEQQEGGVELRRVHQRLRGEDADITAAIPRGAHEVLDIESGLAEEMRTALLLQHQQRALDRADRRFGDVAVFRGERVGPRRQILEQRLQVLEIDERHILVASDLEGDVQHAFLRLAQIHQTRQQQRPHLGDRRSDRVSLLAEQVPEDQGVAFEFVLVADLLVAGLDPRFGFAGLGKTGQIAFHIGAEHWNALVGKALGQPLQRNRLARAGGAGDQAMAVGEAQVNELGLDALAQIDAAGGQFLSSSAICCVLRRRRLALGHGSPPSTPAGTVARPETSAKTASRPLCLRPRTLCCAFGFVLGGD